MMELEQKYLALLHEAERRGLPDLPATGLLDGLEREALIERHAEPGDRRALRIRLTRQGQQLARKLFEQHGLWIAGLFGNLTATERTQLARLLDKVATNTGAAHGTA